MDLSCIPGRATALDLSNLAAGLDAKKERYDVMAKEFRRISHARSGVNADAVLFQGPLQRPSGMPTDPIQQSCTAVIMEY